MAILDEFRALPDYLLNPAYLSIRQPNLNPVRMVWGVG